MVLEPKKPLNNKIVRIISKQKRSTWEVEEVLTPSILRLRIAWLSSKQEDDDDVTWITPARDTSWE